MVWKSKAGTAGMRSKAALGAASSFSLALALFPQAQHKHSAAQGCGRTNAVRPQCNRSRSPARQWQEAAEGRKEGRKRKGGGKKPLLTSRWRISSASACSKIKAASGTASGIERGREGESGG